MQLTNSFPNNGDWNKSIFFFSLYLFLRNKRVTETRSIAIRALIIRKKKQRKRTSWSIDNEIYATVGGGRLFALKQIVEKKYTRRACPGFFVNI